MLKFDKPGVKRLRQGLGFRDCVSMLAQNTIQLRPQRFQRGLQFVTSASTLRLS